MAVWVSRGWRTIRQLGYTGLLLAAAVAGCTQQEPEADRSKTVVIPPPVVVAARDPGPGEARLHQPFLQAVLLEPPDNQDQLRPPDKTKAGKNVAKLYEAVVGKDGVGGLWDQVKFVSPAGKRLAYTATIETELGKITIELWPDVAPNHVRNFVALARAGYYDGLEFDRTVYEKIGDAKDAFLEYLEAGCPLGTADPNYGSIGYWLKPELNEQVKHEAGTLGAWHAEEVETAACKFYITLDKAPWMDGNWTIFGKITQGLDVARAIRARPVRNEEKDRPVQPVVMRAVTIASKEVEASATAGQAP